MATLYIFRHAQASMFAANYDQLSERGREQARLLGEALTARGVEFDAVYSGPAKRHLDTAALAGYASPTVLPGFDEHDGQQLVARALPKLAKDAALAALAARAADRKLDKRERSKVWQKLFETAMRGWLSGELEPRGVETYAQFSGRVRGALDTVRREARGRVALFTSVGPTAQILADVLQVPAERGFETGWRLYNASITRVIYSGDRMTLDGFNEVAHLPADMVTHR